MFFFLFSTKDYNAIKEKNDKLNQLVDNQNETVKLCLSCKEHEVTIGRLQQTLLKLNEQYDTIKLQYQRLLSAQYTPRGCPKSGKYDYN
jgi:hypothetical protein